MALFDQLAAMARRHAELADRLGQPATMADAALFARSSKEFAELDPVVEAYRVYQRLQQEAAEATAIATDPDADADMRHLAREEGNDLKHRLEEQLQRLRLMLIPADPDDAKNVILEIRAGTGGEEAALFAADLFRMYARFAEARHWRVEVLSTNPTALGGLREVIAMVSGQGAYSTFKFESGVHRVQRIPATEAGGRIHTSACTVAILPEASAVDVVVEEKDLRIDVYRSSGPGGQSVNTTDSAVRITHLPTGLVVTCQDEKSQFKNKAKAMKVLTARLYDAQQQAADDERSRQRRTQVGSGDRSERIRTYNFPQNRLTDHRINLTLHRLDAIVAGDLAEVVDALAAHHQAELLSRLGEEAG
ncbi:MAG: peptide chain release factor 1 [Magnetococcales bacterium]|nr:peptide chain release factor 1 [Magnetococcales bacterium]